MKYIKYILFSIILFLSATSVYAKEITINLFYSKTCPHCAAEKEFLNEYIKENSNVKIKLFEVTENEYNSTLLDNVKTSLGSINNYVPYTVIGEIGLTGYSDNIKSQIKHFVDKYQTEDYYDLVKAVEEKGEAINIEEEPEKKENKESDTIELPLFGKVEKSKISLPLVSIVIGFIDGFNPCAMWILIFLISMLLSVKDKKRRIGLGLIFLISSGLVYLLFMVAWLKVMTSTVQISFVQKIIGLVAIIGAIWNLKGYFDIKNKEIGCSVTNEEDKKKTMIKIKNAVSQNSFILAAIGLVGLAFSVNLVEFACSAGWPVVFTELLALHNLSKISYLIYILIYILFYMIDDIIIFIIAMVTLEVTGISNKYNKYSHLIGGVLMLIIGILMILKPSILMLNF